MMGWFYRAFDYLAGYFGTGGARLITIFAAVIVLAVVVSVVSFLF